MKDVPRELIERAFTSCQRGSAGHCINTNLVRAYAKHQGRKIRAPMTYKGDFHWSECVDGQWCMFVAPLTLKYVKKIDGYDHDAKHFDAPAKCPMGPVRFVGFCTERSDDPQVVRERRARVNARVAEGKLVPGSRFRERQTPYVLAQNGAE